MVVLVFPTERHTGSPRQNLPAQQAGYSARTASCSNCQERITDPTPTACTELKRPKTPNNAMAFLAGTKWSQQSQRSGVVAHEYHPIGARRITAMSHLHAQTQTSSRRATNASGNSCAIFAGQITFASLITANAEDLKPDYSRPNRSWADSREPAWQLVLGGAAQIDARRPEKPGYAKPHKRIIYISWRWHPRHYLHTSLCKVDQSCEALFLRL